MKQTQSLPYTLQRSTLTLVLVGLSSLIPPQSGSKLHPSSLILPALAGSAPAKLHFAAPRLPEDPGEPGGRGRGGASRIPTCKPYEPFTALMPVAQTGSQKSLWGLTTLDHPTLWFYLPKPLTAKMPLKFVLRDRDDNVVYTAAAHMPAPAGIIRVDLPQTIALEVHQVYKWAASVQCDSADSGAVVWQEGSIQRVPVAPNLQQQLKAAKTPLDRAILFAKDGIWLEALTTLADAMQQHGTTDRAIVSAWTDLLNQGQLSRVAQATIVPCCQLK